MNHRLDPTGRSAQLHRQAESHHRNKRYGAAIKLYEKLVDADQADSALYFALADAHASLGDFALAIPLYQSSLILEEASNPQTLQQLSRAHFQLGDLGAALHSLERATSASNVLLPWLGLATLAPLAPDSTHAYVRATREKMVRRLAASPLAVHATLPPLPIDSNGALRVGYLSSHFDKPNYMKPVWAALNNHDRDSIELHMIFDGPSGKPLRGYDPMPSDSVHYVEEDSNQQVFDRIRDLQIQVLVDLNSYSVPKRLGLFVQRPAPVTVAWFNSFATSALPGIDAIVGDSEVIDGDETQHYTEQVVRLPVSYLTFAVPYDTPPVVPPPVVKNGTITFGSLAAQYKITPPVLDAWAKILQDAPESRLLLANRVLDRPSNVKFVQDAFLSRGVMSDRLILHGSAPHKKYLGYYDRIDIALDPFPYSGGTTTMEALWQGVPVLTVAGDRWASRTSRSLLKRSHLADFVLPTVDDLVKRAIQMAQSDDTPSQLASMRAEMRERLEGESVMNGPALARHLEKIYRTLYLEYASR